MPDIQSDAISGEAFETSVRQVAKHLYQGASRTGSIMIDGRERDEIVDTGTELIIIEATKKRTLDKVKYDLKKSAELVRRLRNDSRYSEYNFRIILVTLDDPTADQNGYVSTSKIGCPKEIISFTALFSRLFDARHYIRLRSDHSFGSIRNPADDQDLNVPQSAYIPTALSVEGTGEALKASDLSEKVASGGRFIIFGDYGSGKSMTLRDIYFRVRDRFIKGEISSCPVYLNLREHIAQIHPDEALYRHADRIGFANSQSLISAWRAGYITLFLDGFDELTPPQFAVSIDNLRQARRFAVELVKTFFDQTPRSATIFLAGRENYFDDRDEARKALGYGSNATVLDLSGFTDSDIEKFLKAKKGKIPTWLPTRPLLLGYIANSGLLKDEGLLALDPAPGWDQILQRVCEREVQQIWGVGFEAADLRQFIEGLATRARRVSGGGLQHSDLRYVFHSVFGRDADEPADLLTGRLPGLGSVAGKVGTREFIDRDFVQVASSGDLSRFIEVPFQSSSPLQGSEEPLDNLGREVAAWRLSGAFAKLSIALKQASTLSEMSATAGDIFAMMNDQGASYVGDHVTVRDAYFDVLELDPSHDLSKITFDSCIISHLELSRSSIEEERRNFPRFCDCAIDKVEGVVSESDVPKGILVGKTTVESYAAYAATNQAVIRSNLPDSVKVLITVLRKLFLQRGSGRRHSALRRGIPQNSVRLVDPIVDLIKSNDFAEDVSLDRRLILVPNRSKSGEALSMVNGPNTSNHSLIEAVRRLS